MKCWKFYVDRIEINTDVHTIYRIREICQKIRFLEMNLNMLIIAFAADDNMSGVTLKSLSVSCELIRLWNSSELWIAAVSEAPPCISHNTENTVWAIFPSSDSWEVPGADWWAGTLEAWHQMSPGHPWSLAMVRVRGSNSVTGLIMPSVCQVSRG